MALVVDGVLSATALRKASTRPEFAAGQDGEAAVSGVQMQPGRAHGWLAGHSLRAVVLDWSKGRLHGGCGCRESRGDTLCRHVVALGLAALTRARLQVPQPTRAPDTTPYGEPPAPLSPVEQWLTTLSLTQLQDLVLEVAALSPDATRLLETSAALALGETETVRSGLVEAVESALGPESEARLSPETVDHWDGDYWDHDDEDYYGYHESYRLAQDVSAVLDELEGHLDRGHADLTLEPLQLALTRVCAIMEQADDSSGMLGAACERAATLYARACREGHPDGRALATWLASFRATSGGWPELTLTDILPAFDETSLAVYREAVTALDCGADEESTATSRMLLELADHDGDVDAAVGILRRGEHPAYGAIIARLERAGRVDEAQAVTDRAVAEGRVAIRAAGGHLEDHGLDPEHVAYRYLELGRPDDAIAMLRKLFDREQGVAAYRILLAVADRVDALEKERERVLALVRRKAKASRNGTLLVQLLLSDGDIDGAWAVADDIGPGNAWEELAKEAAETHPLRAADLYRPRLADLLSVPKTGYYPWVAEILTTMRRL